MLTVLSHDACIPLGRWWTHAWRELVNEECLRASLVNNQLRSGGGKGREGERERGREGERERERERERGFDCDAGCAKWQAGWSLSEAAVVNWQAGCSLREDAGIVNWQARAVRLWWILP